MLFFFGHGTSGTTLVGALLDAHPNIIIANEYDVPGKWIGLKKKEQTRDYLFQALFTNSYGQSKFGRRQENCPRIRSMNVPNQWQGKFDKRIKVIMYSYVFSSIAYNARLLYIQLDHRIQFSNAFGPFVHFGLP